MEIRFRTRKMEKHYRHHQEAEQAYGKEVARRYIERVNLIKQAHDIEGVKALPGLRCHPLTGNRKGQWAINLTGSVRLIFTLEVKLLEIACIEEVSKHYDD
ncbi:MAG: type II toxin-antitoxin system RelE/ParE family toxin [Deltaproteobacteria bacterium]|nr:type II toxin-antitoxin system RelE/ParE family toxin [Deltaproteobacteria bacterium]